MKNGKDKFGGAENSNQNDQSTDDSTDNTDGETGETSTGSADGDSDSTDDSTGDDTDSSAVRKTVDRKAYDQVRADMLKFKKQVKDFEAKQREEKLRGHREKQEWQKVAELKEKEANEEREKSSRLMKTIITDKKMAAIRNAATKEGILDSALEDLELIDWSDVEIETTSSGRINVHGAEDAIKRTKALKPHWFGKAGAKFSTRVPGAREGEGEALVTVEKLNKLRTEAKKSGDYSTYEKAFKSFTAQNQKK